jgi:predicted phage-related endonuclease
MKDKPTSESMGSAAEHAESVAVAWPDLSSLIMADSDREVRRSGIGGSDANVILSGDTERINRLWSEKRGARAAEDLSDKLAVVLGCWTEPFNRMWFEKTTGQAVSRIGDHLVSITNPWRRCSLDGYVDDVGAVFEAKHTNGFTKADELLERYMPQLQHNMAVAQADRAILSVIFGNHRFEIIEIAADWLYQLDLFHAERQFWNCVVTGKEPVAVAPLPPPKPIGSREVSLEGNNAWASAAVDWLQNRAAAKVHAGACTTIKRLVDADVSRAFGHGIEAKRSKSGALSIRALEL